MILLVWFLFCHCHGIRFCHSLVFGVLLLLTSSEHTRKVDLSRVHEDASETDDDVERLQQHELESIQKLLGSTTTQQVDSASPPRQLERSEEIQEDEQQVDDEQPPLPPPPPPQQQQQQEMDKEEVEVYEKQQQLNEEDGDVESQNYSESENAQQTVEESEPQSLQQPETELLEMPNTVNSQVEEPSETRELQRTDSRASGQQTVHMQVDMKTSSTPEKKQQQVAVVHAHERSYPRPEDRALSRIRNERQESSMSREPTIESHLSIDSASSHQLSQASLLWRNEQSQAGTQHQDIEQTASLQQQYEQLKYQLQQQLELQRSQLEREYQLREDQMKQQMTMQWNSFTQQQQQQQQQRQQQQWQWQMSSDVRHDSNTRCQDDPRCIVSCSSFPQAPGCSNVSTTCNPVSVQQVHPPHTEWTQGQQRCSCDDAVPTKTQRNYPDNRPVVVDVVSHTRGRDGDRSDAGRGGWSGYDGGHCRIIVGDQRTTMNDERRRDSSDVDSVEQTGRMLSSGPADQHVCRACGLCRQQYDTSDGKDVVQ